MHKKGYETMVVSKKSDLIIEWEYIDRCTPLNKVPLTYRSARVCRWAVLRKPSDLQYVPSHLFWITSRQLLEQNGLLLKVVLQNSFYEDEDELGRELLCRTAVKQNGLALQFVPYYLKTPELCEFAVKKNGLALQFVPQELKKTELCKIAVEQNPMALQFVPEELKKPELCKIALKQNAMALEFIPDKLKTFEICKNAVIQKPMALKYISKIFN